MKKPKSKSVDVDKLMKEKSKSFEIDIELVNTSGPKYKPLKIKCIQESLDADFYAPLEYIAKHRYARRLLTNLFNTPMDECLEQEVLVSSVIVDSEDNFKFIKAAKQLDTLVDLGAAEKSPITLNQKYAITLKGHDALVTYQNLFDEALALKNDRKWARKLVITLLEAAAKPQEKP